MDAFSYLSVCGFGRYFFKSVAPFQDFQTSFFSSCRLGLFCEGACQRSVGSPQHPWNGDFPVPLSSLPLIHFCLFSVLSSVFPCVSLSLFSEARVCCCLPADCFPSGGQEGRQRGGHKEEGGIGKGARGLRVWSEGLDHT